MTIAFNKSIIARMGIVAALGLSTAGCTSVGKALGMGKASPDEFAVVTKAPLVIPPDFSLKPPKPGAPPQNELDPAKGAKDALYSQLGTQGASGSTTDGEIALITAAGATDADNSIRDLINSENFSTGRADRSFSDKLMFWQNNPAQSLPKSEEGNTDTADKEG